MRLAFSSVPPSAEIDFNEPITLLKPKPVRIQGVKTPRIPKVIEPTKAQIEASIQDCYLSLAMDNSLMTHERVSIDTETPGLQWRLGDSPWMVSMADADNNSWCSIYPINPFTRRVSYDFDLYDHSGEVEARTEYLREICWDKNRIKVFFNGPFDIGNLRNMKIEVRGKIEEVSLEARVFRTDEIAYKLKYLAKKYRNLDSGELPELKKIVGKLRKLAKIAGWKIFQEEDTTNSNAGKEGKIPPDYWLVMLAHLLIDDQSEIDLCRELAEDYCRKDTFRTIVLDTFYQRNFLIDEAHAKSYRFEMDKVFPILREMEDRGISTYKEKIIADRQICIDLAEKTLIDIREYCGKPTFKPSETAKYSEYLFSDPPQGLGLAVTEQTKTGQYKTGQDELIRAGIAHHPFIQMCSRYSTQTKAITLFYDKYLDNILPDPENPGRWILYTEINQGNTKTFRLSFSNPNLQQASSPETSKRGANVVQVRSSMFPRPNHNWFLLDYSGQELRLMGGLMRIKLIIDAVKNNQDFPTIVSNNIWGGEGNEIGINLAVESCELYQDHASTIEVREMWEKFDWTPGRYTDRKSVLKFAEEILSYFKYDFVKMEEGFGKKVARTIVKNVLYAEAYGAGIPKIALQIGTTVEKAGEIKKQISDQLPEKKTASKEWIAQAEKDGYIINAYGRKINVDREFSYRAVNYAIQSTAADMMKLSMVNCHPYLKKTGLKAHMILTVHDELAFEIHKEHSYPWLIRGVKTIMEDHEKYVHIPMSVGISKCPERWDLEQKVKL